MVWYEMVHCRDSDFLLVIGTSGASQGFSQISEACLRGTKLRDIPIGQFTALGLKHLANGENLPFQNAMHATQI